MIRMATISLCLTLVCLVKVNAGPLKTVPRSLSPDINQVVRYQMENLRLKYNAQKMTQGHFYESLKDQGTLKSLKNDLKKDFRKIVSATGRQLSNNGHPTKSTRAVRGPIDTRTTSRREQNQNPIRKTRLERLRKHYGKNFETPKAQWYAGLLDPLTSME